MVKDFPATKNVNILFHSTSYSINIFDLSLSRHNYGCDQLHNHHTRTQFANRSCFIALDLGVDCAAHARQEAQNYNGRLKGCGVKISLIFADVIDLFFCAFAFGNILNQRPVSLYALSTTFS